METVEKIKLTDISKVTTEIKDFVIEFGKTGTNTCLIIDFGLVRDRNNVQAYGEEDTCKEIFGKIKYKWIGNITNPLLVSKRYSKGGDYIIKVNAANQISSDSVEYFKNVIGKYIQFNFITLYHFIFHSEIDCKQPQITVFNQQNDWRRAEEVWKSKRFQVFTQTIVDCNATHQITRVWNAYLMDPETGNFTQQIDLSSLDSQTKSILYIPPFYLEPGVYKFVFSVNMTSPHPHPLLPFFASAETFVKIVRSPISPQLADGAQSRVIRGWGQR